MGGADLGIVAIGESARWWHFVMPWEPYFLTLMWIGMIPCGFIFLITWRIARRFGGRGLAVVICVVAVVGPLRDSWYMTMFPEWGSYAPGFAPNSGEPPSIDEAFEKLKRLVSAAQLLRAAGCATAFR